MKKKKFIIIGVLAVVVLAVLGGIWSLTHSKEEKKANHYETMVAQKALPLTMSGNVSPKEVRSFMVTKKNLAQMEVKDGQKVTNGQVLYTTYNQANASELDELKVTLAKYQRAKTTANKKLQDARNTLNKMQSSDEGYSEAKDAVASANDEVADATGKKQEATITLVDAHPTTTNATNGSKYKVYADLDAKNFIDGQTIKAKVAQAGIIIAKSCVRQGKVYVVEDGKVTSQAITGKEVDGQYIVTAGLTAGQKVVSNPDGDLKEGEQLP